MAHVLTSAGWEEELEIWLEPFLERLGRSEQRLWASLYMEGLGLPEFHGHLTKRGIASRQEVFHVEEEKAVHP